jgi:DNA invertase Pin-like site-specific DNA recombinase
MPLDEPVPLFNVRCSSSLPPIEGYAKAAGMVIVDWFYDKAVRGADAITDRPGFAAMLDRIASNGVRSIIVENPDRFARDLAVQLAGHDHLRKLGVTLIPATAPDFFTEDTPTASPGASGARCHRPV